MFDIISKRFRFFLISGVMILIGIVALATFGLKASIDFSAGSFLTLKFDQPVTISQLRNELNALGYQNSIIQTTSTGDMIIRSRELTTAEKTKLEADLTAKLGTLTERSFESVDPIVARQTTRTAGIAVAVATVGILLYLTWAFRKMPRPLRYGACAVIALAHDVLITIGLFALLGGFFGWEVNLMFVTGILSVLGYSVNNTVIVFDRIRENVSRGAGRDFETLVNNSVLETVTRNLNTSITTIITIVAVLLFVGSGVQNFAIILLLGVLVGIFDSMFVAPALLVVWEKKEWYRFLPFLRKKSS